MKQTPVFVFLVICLTILALSSCDIYEQDDYQEYIVVEAYAIANSPLPAVYVSTTVPVEQEYNRDELILQDATVQIVLLDVSGNELDVFQYHYSTEKRAYTTQSDHIVQPKSRYRIDINFKDRPEIIRATTTVPDEFNVINEIPESIIYQSIEQLEITITAPSQIESQNIYVFTTESLDPIEDNLTPFYKAAFENENIDLIDVRINSSGLINEGNFEINPDGTITLRFPWIGVAFYGENLLVTSAVDRNLAELIRSQQVQLGGSTLSPGEIPNITYNIEGGIGVFGSISTDTVKTTFLRP